MSASLPLVGAAPHHKRLEGVRCKPAKALKKLDPSGEDLRWRGQMALAVQRCFDLAHLTQKEAAGLMNRDVAQVSRWMTGEERPLFDAIFAVEDLRRFIVQALAEVAGTCVELETVIRIRRAK